jgi:hypothetical protein
MFIQNDEFKKQAKKFKKNTDEFKKYRALELLWLQKGGNPDELRVAFQEGNSKTPTGAKFNEVLKKAKAGQSISVGEAIAAAVSALFGKKYDPSTGKVIGATGAEELPTVLATAPVWLPILREVVSILGGAFNVGGSQPAPGETITTDTTTTTSARSNSALLPIILVGGAAAAYYLLYKKK